ncbi:MAG TPA: hypothetical protein VM659_13010 [Dongiaceae bacterium]|nr:hypothetical protein [Dongiaceae bacterium]
MASIKRFFGNCTPVLTPNALIIAACVLLIARLGLAHIGILEPVNADSPDLSAPGLLTAVLWHAAFGTLLFIGTIGIGLAALSLAPKRWGLLPTDHMVLSLFFGLILALVICVGVQFFKGSGFWALGIVLGVTAARLPAILPLFTKYPSLSPRQQSWKRLLPIYCLGIALSAHLGLLWRLPSENFKGTVDLGDLTFYAASYYSLKLNLFPFHSLALEGLDLLPFNQLAGILAFAFDRFPRFEISLFLTTSVSLFFFLSVVFIVEQMLRYREIAGRPPLDAKTQCIIVLILCTATRYPSWIVESPPFAFGFPIGLGIVYMVDRGKDRIGYLYLTLPLAVIGFGISKVVAIAVFSCYAGCCLWNKVRTTGSKTAFMMLIAGAAAVAIFSLFVVAFFAPSFISLSSAADYGPPSIHIFQNTALPPAPDLSHSKVLKKLLRYLGQWGGYIMAVLPTLAADIGLLLMLLASWRLKNLPLFAATLLGIALFFGYPFLFNGSAASVFILMAGWFILDPNPRPRSAPILITIAAGLTLFSHLYNELGGPIVTIIWVFTLGGALVLVLQQPAPIDTRLSNQPTERHGTWRYWLALTALLTVFANAEGDLRFLPRFTGPNRAIVSTSLYDLWNNVRRLTPSDALIFTDQTGEEPTRLKGWNDYAGISERQFYISSWAGALALRGDENAKRARLNNNLAVIAGQLRPNQLQLRRSYSSYYAAVSAGTSVPKAFKSIYNNGEYAIYEIPPQQTD